jgi:hypothetical protein
MPHARTLIVEVCQALRGEARKALAAAGVRIEAEGYTDSSTTMWGFRVRSGRTQGALQDVVWGYPGLGSISVTVRPPRDE